ncbi:MAG TPA: hypothetical protein PL032_13535 [Syntrophorhabdus sp.]|nr:hypothetical protein [Syntrophorhabdus sp.]
MEKYFVLKVTYASWKGFPICYTKNKHAGPFSSHKEAQLVANEENDIRRRRKEDKWIFQVGMQKEIGASGIIL